MKGILLELSVGVHTDRNRIKKLFSKICLILFREFVTVKVLLQQNSSLIISCLILYIKFSQAVLFISLL